MIQWDIVAHVFTGGAAACIGWWIGNKLYDWRGK